MAAEFSTSILIELIERVQGPGQQVVATFNQIREAADRMAERLQVGVLTAALNFLKKLGPEGEVLQGWVNKVGDGFRALGSVASGAFSIIRSAVSGLIGALKTLMTWVGVGGILSVGGFLTMANRWAEMTKEQVAFADQIGITTSLLKGLQYAAEETGVGTGRLNSALQYFGRSLGMLKLGDEGGGPLKAFLEKAGDPVLLQRLRAAKDEGEALSLIFAAINRQTDKSMATALASAAFGGRASGASMVRLARADAPGLIREQKEYQNLQPGLIKASEQAADRYTRSVLKLGQAWKGMQTTVLTPVMNELSKIIDNWADWMKDTTNRQWVSNATLYIIDKIKDGAKWIRDWLSKPENRQWVSDKTQDIVDGIKATMQWLQQQDWTSIGQSIAAGFKWASEEVGRTINDIKAMYYMAETLFAAGKYGVGSPEWHRSAENYWKTQPRTEWPNWMKATNPPAAPKGALEKGWIYDPNIDKWRTPKYQDRLTPGAPEPAPSAAAPGQGSFWNSVLDAITPTFAPAPKWAKNKPKPTGLFEDFFGALFGYGPALGAEAMGEAVPPLPTRKPAPPTPAAKSWWDYLPSIQLPNLGYSLGSMVHPSSYTVPVTSGGLRPQDSGTLMYSALKMALDDLTRSKPAELAANAPAGGVPPTGITIQAQGPSVMITQAPPSVNIAVSVNVMRPDEAPVATATAVAHALGNEVVNRGHFEVS